MPNKKGERIVHFGDLKFRIPFNVIKGEILRHNFLPDEGYLITTKDIETDNSTKLKYTTKVLDAIDSSFREIYGHKKKNKVSMSQVYRSKVTNILNDFVWLNK